MMAFVNSVTTIKNLLKTTKSVSFLNVSQTKKSLLKGFVLIVHLVLFHLKIKRIAKSENVSQEKFLTIMKNVLSVLIF